MSDIEHEIDYNEPFRAREVFRISRKGIPEDQPPVYDEFTAETAFCWEDVRGVDGYFYDPSVWTKYPGEKFYVLLAGQAQPKLILGPYKKFLDLWTELRARYPMFGGYDDED